jgi:peptidoglycan hydrolase-like protein with peptidoglycan-binding domain
LKQTEINSKVGDRLNLFELSAKISADTRDYEKAVKNATKVSKSLKDIMERSATQSETNKNKIKVLASEYSSAKAKVATLTTAFNKAAKEEGITAERTKQLAKELQEAEKESSDLKGQLDELTKKSKNAGDGFSKLGSALGKGLKTAGKIGIAAVGAAAAGITALTKSAIDNYAEYEQLVGGVETLFGNSYETLDEYKESVLKSKDSIKEFQKQFGLAVDGIAGPQTMAAIENAFSTLTDGSLLVMENARVAFRTAGLSANDYMETVTSFSASLIQSLGGDTAEAARIADVAIVDMADNANKMGTSMEMIQNAYQGFAKQNYTIKFIYSPAA